MSEKELNIRNCMLYEYKLGRKAKEAANNIRTVFGKDATNERKCSYWFAKFDAGDFSLSKHTHKGRPLKIEAQELEDLLSQDPCQSSRTLSKKLGVAYKTVQYHLKKLGKVKINGAWVSGDPDELKEKTQHVTKLRNKNQIISNNNEDGPEEQKDEFKKNVETSLEESLKNAINDIDMEMLGKILKENENNVNINNPTFIHYPNPSPPPPPATTDIFQAPLTINSQQFIQPHANNTHLQSSHFVQITQNNANNANNTNATNPSIAQNQAAIPIVPNSNLNQEQIEQILKNEIQY